MNPTLEDWKNTTTLGLVEQLPLQNYDSAFVKVEGYLSSVGGWTPDSEDNPTGPGLPVNGDIPETAIPAIVAQYHDRIYTTNVNATITVNLDLITNTQSGMSDASILTAIESEIEIMLSEKFENIPVNFVSLDAYTGTVVDDGLTTKAERVSIYNASLLEDVIDPRAIALQKARNRYNLSNEWSVYSVYTESDSDLVVTIRKYTTSSYTTEDNTVGNQYVFKLNPIKYTIVSGLNRPIQI